MEFPSSGVQHTLTVDEYDTTKTLAHARQQADARKFDDMLIVDMDTHHEEAASFRDIAKYMDEPVERQLAMSASGGGSRPSVPFNICYEDAPGLMQRFAVAKLEETPDNVHRDIALANRRMEAMGVDYSLMLPTTALRLGFQPKKHFEVGFALAYNRWLADTLLPQAPRLRGMLYLPLYDDKACAQTVEELGDKPGIAGALIASPRYASVHHNGYMRTYKALEERGLLLAFHSGPNWTDRTMSLSNRYLAVKALGGPHFNSVHLTNWLVNGMPERVPKLKVLWMESGIAWAVALMLRLDAEYMMRSFDAPALVRKPSDYMREMFYSTQPLERPDDPALLEALFKALNAETQLVWGSNFPGSDFDLPSTVYDLPFLSEQAKRAILGGTAAKLLRINP
jgi:predicted TIM-barrel fold metal-dependent hydrolase